MSFLRVHRPLRWAALLVVLPATTVACAFALTRRANGPTLESKRVYFKEAPHYLIAEDGSVCAMPTARFQTIGVGEATWCVWQGTPRRSHRPW